MSYRKKVGEYVTAVFDTETDPFEAGRLPEPFTCGFMTADGLYHATWGENCVLDMMRHIKAMDAKYLIYVHNGGKFDFHFLWDYIEEPVFIINGRLVEFSMSVGSNRKPQHIWRDSLSIIPVPLADYQKTKIDYKIFERDRRDLPHNKAKIQAYLKDDCRDLLSMVSAFRDRFEENGQVPITIGQTALREFRKLHEYDRATDTTDKLMRAYYFGGRTQCFAAGVLKGPWVYYDINSSYPASMRNAQHPLTDDWEALDEPPDDGSTWFAHVRARQRNAIPMRLDERTEFDVREGVFFACSHELVPAIEAGMIEVDEWIKIERPTVQGDFSVFVDKFIKDKIEADRTGDKAGRLFAKLLLNSCYGKLGQDPRKYSDYALCRDMFGDKDLLHKGFQPETLLRHSPYLELWSKPSMVMGFSFNNVGIAASITSASRALLLDGLRQSVRPIYCDTDSVICERFDGWIDDSALGAWKHETWTPPGSRHKEPVVADYAAIAGRKTYCLYNVVKGRAVPIKWASKGGDLTPSEIIGMARGGEFFRTNEAPTFSTKSAPRFISRTFRKTVDDDVAPF